MRVSLATLSVILVVSTLVALWLGWAKWRSYQRNRDYPFVSHIMYNPLSSQSMHMQEAGPAFKTQLLSRIESVEFFNTVALLLRGLRVQWPPSPLFLFEQWQGDHRRRHTKNSGFTPLYQEQGILCQCGQRRKMNVQIDVKTVNNCQTNCNKYVYQIVRILFV